MKNKLGQNIRTRVSTLIAVGAYFNTLLAMFDPSIIGDNETAILVYRVLSAVLAFCAWANSHYFNQDYSPESATATIKMRDAKKKRMNDQEWVEEPEDSYEHEEEIIAEESEVSDGEE